MGAKVIIPEEVARTAKKVAEVCQDIEAESNLEAELKELIAEKMADQDLDPFKEARIRDMKEQQKLARRYSNRRFR